MRIRIGKTQHQKLLTDLGERLGGTPKDGLEYVLDTWLIDGKPNSGAAAQSAPSETDNSSSASDEDLETLVDWS